jgi:hypothetical protein
MLFPDLPSSWKRKELIPGLQFFFFDAFTRGGGRGSPPEYIASKEHYKTRLMSTLRVNIGQDKYFVTAEKEKKDDINT